MVSVDVFRKPNGQVSMQNVTKLVASDEEMLTVNPKYKTSPAVIAALTQRTTTDKPIDTNKGIRATMVTSKKGNSGGSFFAFNEQTGELWDVGTHVANTEEARGTFKLKPSYSDGSERYNLMLENQTTHIDAAKRLN